MGVITVKVDENLKKMMSAVKINWSAYIREAIRQRIELERRRDSAKLLLEGLKSKKHVVPKDFVNKTVRDMRETS